MNYYDPIGYWSPTYKMEYFNGYGQNFYYGEYGYYEKSLNLNPNIVEEPAWIGFMVSAIFACWVICISLNLKNLGKMRENMRLEAEKKK